MGYGYGVWIVLPLNVVKTHIPHITIACKMKRSDAFSLYHEFIELNGKNVRCFIDLSQHDVLGPDYYEMNTADAGWSWGYKAEVYANMPTNIERSCLPLNHHITMQYENDKKNLRPTDREIKYLLMGKVVVADIRSKEPGDWHIISESCQ